MSIIFFLLSHCKVYIDLFYCFYIPADTQITRLYNTLISQTEVKCNLQSICKQAKICFMSCILDKFSFSSRIINMSQLWTWLEKIFECFRKLFHLQLGRWAGCCGELLLLLLVVDQEYIHIHKDNSFSWRFWCLVFTEIFFYFHSKLKTDWKLLSQHVLCSSLLCFKNEVSLYCGLMS